jgi:hypothetical protein
MTELAFFEYAQVLAPFGLQLPTRMTAVCYGAHELALISPVPIDDALAARLSVLGEVRLLIAPNLLHSSYLGAARARYPLAKVLAPRGLQRKKPRLPIDGALEAGLPSELAQVLELVPVEGAPRVDEFAFFHRASRTLVVTDLVFNVVQPRGWFTHLVMYLVGCHARFGMSRSWRLLVRNRATAAASIEQLLALPVERVAMAHGELVHERAHTRLTEAVRWLRPYRRALPA